MRAFGKSITTKNASGFYFKPYPDFSYQSAADLQSKQ